MTLEEKLEWGRKALGITAVLLLYTVRGRTTLVREGRRLLREATQGMESDLAELLDPVARTLIGLQEEQEDLEGSLLADLERKRVHIVRLRTEEEEQEGNLEALLKRTTFPALPPFLPPLEVVRVRGDLAICEKGNEDPDWDLLIPRLLNGISQAFPAWSRCSIRPGEGRFAVWVRRKAWREEEVLPLREALGRAARTEVFLPPH
ncbi:MAG: hypothetical protein ABDH20_13165 [Thermus sp.]